MILHGNQRGGARNLALHLLKSENEHVEVYELRGFVSGDLVSALNEIHAVSRGTKARQFLFSLSLNPPATESVPTAAFEDAIERVERTLGLEGQPRAIVFHEKQGRRHCHAVWSRIDTAQMKAVPLPYTKRKLVELSRELFLEHGWTLPRGLINPKERDPRNFTLAQWQQAKRIGKNPKRLKADFQDCWAISDSQDAFAKALEERGYVLARGDRRGFVAVDQRCEVFSIAKWVGIRTKQVRARLTEPERLPGLSEARARIAKNMDQRLKALQQSQDHAIAQRLAEIDAKVRQMTQTHAQARESLQKAQAQRRSEETQARRNRLRTGLKGLLDRVTGKRRRIQQDNQKEAWQGFQRDQKERDALIFSQLRDRRGLQARIERLQTFNENARQALTQDRRQYRDIRDQRLEHFTPAGQTFRPRRPARPGYER
ncbi:MAG: relaxase/mobilization nuclease domain-containing protein [Chromatiales bacterium]|nr:relaxase/mobilization nuclease domain-containing protein [Chromatiales bacterium]